MSGLACCGVRESVAVMPDPGLVQGAAESVDAWQRAWEQYLHYCGDPVAEASQAGRRDESFVMGPLFASVYRILAGAPTDAPALRQDAARALSRGRTAEDRERAHTAALRSLLAGEFTAAALAWDAIARRGRDFAAARFAHDVYLHVGDDDRRLASSSHAEECWRDQPGYGFVAGQHAFALEEAGRYAEAEEFGRHALSLDPDDL